MSVPSFELGSSALQISVVVSILIAGLLASPHCLSMCGPLSLAIGTNRKRTLLQQFGRGLGYAMLGAVAGGIGPNWIESRPPTLLSILSIGVIAGIVIWSAIKIGRGGMHENSSSQGTPYKLRARIWARILEVGAKAPNFGAFAAGFASFLLPCGQLYLFAAAAVATGSASSGAAVLSLFWLGTLPSFLVGPMIVRRWLAPFANRAPKLAAVFLLIAGFASLALFARSLHKAHADSYHIESPDASAMEKAESCH